MIGTVIFLIFIAAVSGYIYLDTKEKQDKQEESYEQYEYTNSTDTSDMTDEELKEELINQIRGININLVELQNQLDKQNEKINKIQDNVGCITFVICIPFVISIILQLITGFSLLELLRNL